VSPGEATALAVIAPKSTMGAARRIGLERPVERFGAGM